MVGVNVAVDKVINVALSEEVALRWAVAVAVGVGVVEEVTDVKGSGEYRQDFNSIVCKSRRSNDLR